MPRKTPVRELQQADEDSNHPASPLRRSSRLASPGPSQLIQRRNSASNDAPAKVIKAKRLSLSREIEDNILKAEDKGKESAPDTPRRSTRSTRSASKSPSALPGETESKSRTRSGSISKIVEEEETDSKHVEDDNKKASSKSAKQKAVRETTPTKPRTRRTSITEKISSLEAIEESPKMETRQHKTTLKPIDEDKDSKEETTPLKSVKVDATVEIDEDIETKKAEESAETKSKKEEVSVVNGTASPDTSKQIMNETNSCKISPVVILNSIEKQMQHPDETIPLKPAETPVKKDEFKPVKGKSPVVVLQSIEKIIIKQDHEKLTDKDQSKVMKKDEDEKITNELEESKKEAETKQIDDGDNCELNVTVKSQLSDSNVSEKKHTDEGENGELNETEKSQINENKRDQLEVSNKIIETTKSQENQEEIKDGQSSEITSIESNKNIVSTENESVNISNSSENSDKENRHHNDEDQIIIGIQKTTDHLEPKVKEALKDITLSNDKTEQASFCEPMEIEYTDFNCTVNSTVLETSQLNSEKENSSLPNTSVDKTTCVNGNSKEKASSGVEKVQNVSKDEELIKDVQLGKEIDGVSHQLKPDLKEKDSTCMEKVQDEEVIKDVNLSKELNVIPDLKEKDLTRIEKVQNESKNEEVINDINLCKEPDLKDKDPSYTEKVSNESKHEEVIKELDEISHQAKSDLSIADDKIEETSTDEVGSESNVARSSQEAINGNSKLKSNQELDDNSANNLLENEHEKILPVDTRKSISFAFNLEEEQLLSDEDAVNKSDTAKMETSDATKDNKDEENQESNEEIRVAKSPSPVFSIDESQCLTDEDTQKPSNDVINSTQRQEEESQDKEKETKSPDPVFSDDEYFVDNTNELKENNAINVQEADSQTVYTEKDKNQKDFEGKPQAPQQEKNVNTPAASSSSKLKEKPQNEQSITEKSSRISCESNLTARVRTLIETVDDLDAKVDALIEREMESNNLNAEESDDVSHNSFIDDMAEEGVEDTPSEGSNDIQDEGELLNSEDTSSGSDDGSYEKDSFIDDEEDNSLLSGEEDFLESKSEKDAKRKKKTKRIIPASDSDENPEEQKQKDNNKICENEVCDSDDKMSTEPYLGLTPPSQISPEESEVDVCSVSSGNEVINKTDNLKSLEAMRAETDTKTDNIICLDSDEESQEKSAEITKANKKSRSRTSLNIQENVMLEDVEDGTLTNKISGIVEFFYSNLKRNSLSGSVSLNVSLDFADNEAGEAVEIKDSAEDLQNEAKTKRPKKRNESVSDKETSPKKMRHVSDEDKATPDRKLKRSKRDVTEFDVEPIEAHNLLKSAESTNAEEIQEDNSIKTLTSDGVSAVKKGKKSKKLLTEENESSPVKKGKKIKNILSEGNEISPAKKEKKIKKALLSGENEKEAPKTEEIKLSAVDTSEAAGTSKEKRKHKKLNKKQLENLEGVNDVPKDKQETKMEYKKLKTESLTGDEESKADNSEIDRETTKKKKKLKSKEKEYEPEMSVSDDVFIEQEKAPTKKLKKLKSRKVEITRSSSDENIKYKKTKHITENDENLNFQETQTSTSIKSTAKDDDDIEILSKKIKKLKHKRKHDDDITSSDKAPAEIENVETRKRIKKLRVTETEENPISYFPSYKLEQLDSKISASTEEVPRMKKTGEKAFKKKLRQPTVSLSAGSNRDSWISTPIEDTIIPSKGNSVHSDAGSSKIKKRKIQDETFSSKDFKNKMLYDPNRVKRMPSEELMKKKLKRKLYTLQY